MMNIDTETQHFIYRHKKFDAQRLVAHSTPKRKRFDSTGSDDTYYSSTDADSVISSAPKRQKFMMLDENDKDIPYKGKKLSHISTDKLARIYKYHGNMVRQFPEKQRTAKDQERRDKNTLACRQSRFLKKLQCAVVEEEYNDSLQKYSHIIESYIRNGFYLQELLKLTKEGNKINSPQEHSAAPNPPNKKPFTIAYLLKTH